MDKYVIDFLFFLISGLTLAGVASVIKIYADYLAIKNDLNDLKAKFNDINPEQLKQFVRDRIADHKKDSYSEYLTNKDHYKASRNKIDDPDNDL